MYPSLQHFGPARLLRILPQAPRLRWLGHCIIGFATLVATCSLTSCALISALTASAPASDIIKDLSVESYCSGNLLGQAVVHGSVRNRRHKEVSGIKLRAHVYNRQRQLIERKDFELSVALTPDGEASFKQVLSFGRKQVGDVTVEVIDARD
jgi:hypothetical protein